MPDPAELTPSNSAPKFVGKYRIVRMIARSNDTVYEAIDPHLGRHVALKELTMGADLSGAGRRERIERFHREAKAAGALKHPNIVTIYEVGQHLEHRFIAMEYLEGQTLRNRLTIGGPMPIKEALQIALQLCDALGYAHAQGVVHRDVKPDNIHIIPPGSTVKLTDFGIARVLTEPAITSAGQIFGTPSYMSPEQLTSRSVDHRSDIFSTAIVIYEMLTGKKPFRGDSLSAVTSQIMHAEPSIPSTVPAGIAAILTRAFMKDPDQRYQNMRTLANDLRTELAFSDSPYHTPRSAPSLASEKTVVVGASGPEAPSLVGTEPTVAADAGAGPTVASKTAPTTLSPEPRSFIGSLDADERLRAAVLRLAGSVALLVALLAVTLWGTVVLADRMRGNIRHHQALGSYQQGIADAANGDLSEAISSYEAGMQTVTSADSLYGRCRRGVSDCLAAQATQAETTGNIAGAEELYQESSRADSSNAVPEYDLGVLYASRGDQVNALRQFAAARLADPLSPAGIAAEQKALDGYLQLGDADRSQGNLSLARQDWQRVIDIDPGSPEAQQASARMSSGS